MTSHTEEYDAFLKLIAVFILFRENCHSHNSCTYSVSVDDSETTFTFLPTGFTFCTCVSRDTCTYSYYRPHVSISTDLYSTAVYVIRMALETFFKFHVYRKIKIVFTTLSNQREA